MRNLLSIPLCALALSTAGCDGSSGQASAPAETAPAPVPEVDVPTLAAMLQANQAVAVDANNATTRERFGVIPSSKLLTSSGSYALSELPADKSATLVFYCANTHCTASDAAARRAAEAGYSAVRVLRAGIQGWREAGQATVPPPS